MKVYLSNHVKERMAERYVSEEEVFFTHYGKFYKSPERENIYFYNVVGGGYVVLGKVGKEKFVAITITKKGEKKTDEYITYKELRISEHKKSKRLGRARGLPRQDKRGKRRASVQGK